MGITQQIGDAIVAYLNDAGQQAGFNSAFTAERKNLPLQRIEDLGESLHVLVFPGPRNTAPVSKAKIAKNFQFLIGVVIRRPKEDVAAEDIVIELAEQIEDTMWKKEGLTMGPGKRLESSELTAPPFVPEELENNGVMLSVVPVTYYCQVSV